MKSLFRAGGSVLAMTAFLLAAGQADPAQARIHGGVVIGLNAGPAVYPAPYPYAYPYAYPYPYPYYGYAVPPAPLYVGPQAVYAPPPPAYAPPGSYPVAPYGPQR